MVKWCETAPAMTVYIVNGQCGWGRGGGGKEGGREGRKEGGQEMGNDHGFI